MKLLIKDYPTASVISIIGSTEHGDEIELNKVMVEVSRNTNKVIIDFGGCKKDDVSFCCY